MHGAWILGAALAAMGMAAGCSSDDESGSSGASDSFDRSGDPGSGNFGASTGEIINNK
jgi:hypothetical protein